SRHDLGPLLPRRAHGPLGAGRAMDAVAVVADLALPRSQPRRRAVLPGARLLTVAVDGQLVLGAARLRLRQIAHRQRPRLAALARLRPVGPCVGRVTRGQGRRRRRGAVLGAAVIAPVELGLLVDLGVELRDVVGLVGVLLDERLGHVDHLPVRRLRLFFLLLFFLALLLFLGLLLGRLQL